LLIDKTHLNSLQRTVADLVNAGVTEITYNVLWPGGREDTVSRRLDASDIDVLASQFMGLKESYGNDCTFLGSAAYLERLRCHAREVPVKVQECRSISKTYYVSSDGNLCPCAYTTDKYSEDLLDGSASAWDRGFNNLRNAMRLESHPQCSNCPETSVFGKFD
jgi:hypothetical protein